MCPAGNLRANPQPLAANLGQQPTSSSSHPQSRPGFAHVTGLLITRCLPAAHAPKSPYRPGPGVCRYSTIVPSRSQHRAWSTPHHSAGRRSTGAWSTIHCRPPQPGPLSPEAGRVEQTRSQISFGRASRRSPDPVCRAESRRPSYWTFGLARRSEGNGESYRSAERVSPTIPPGLGGTGLGRAAYTGVMGKRKQGEDLAGGVATQPTREPGSSHLRGGRAQRDTSDHAVIRHAAKVMKAASAHRRQGRGGAASEAPGFGCIFSAASRA